LPANASIVSLPGPALNWFAVALPVNTSLNLVALTLSMFKSVSCRPNPSMATPVVRLTTTR